MTAVTGGGLIWPPIYALSGNLGPVFSTTTLLIDAADEKLAAIFRVPKTGTLDSFEFRSGSVFGTAGGLRVSFQDVDLATGFPDGTQDQYRPSVAVAANSWIQPGLMTDDGTDTGVKRAVTRGTYLAAVVEFESFAVSDYMQIAAPNEAGGTNAYLGGFPYPAGYTTYWGLPAIRCFGILKYDDGTYEMVGVDALPASGLGQLALNTGTTPDEAGIIFQVPFACKVDRAWLRADIDGDADVILYDSDGLTALATVSLDPELRAQTIPRTLEVLFPSAVSLTAATDYRLVLKPTSVTSVQLGYMDVSSVAIMDALPGGSEMHWTQRTDAGAWSQTTTRRAFMSVGISDVTITSSGGGSSTPHHSLGGRVRRGIKQG